MEGSHLQQHNKGNFSFIIGGVLRIRSRRLFSFFEGSRKCGAEERGLMGCYCSK